MKTSELTGAALDWAVAKCEGVETVVCPFNVHPHLLRIKGEISTNYVPSTNWSQGGPIIARMCLDIFCVSNGNGWCAQLNTRTRSGYGHTPLIAAMRCYVASKLGDTVDVPEELTK